MNDEHLKKTAFLYGRNAEKRRRTDASINLESYREYDALCMALRRELTDNDAFQDTITLKAEYIASYEAGRDSVVEYWD
jgi:hypothetical protein